MNTPNLQDFLTYAGSLPNWKYQLGLAQNETAQQQLADQLKLGQGQLDLGNTQAKNSLTLGQGQIDTQNKSLADQLQEFLASLNQQSTQQNWQNQNQQYLESPGYAMSLAQIQDAFRPAASASGSSSGRYSPNSMGYGNNGVTYFGSNNYAIPNNSVQVGYIDKNGVYHPGTQ